jgi:hypothetical protein
MEATVDKCLAFCQALANTKQKFSFALTIGKDNFCFSTFNQHCNVPVVRGPDLKKAIPSRQKRRERRAVDPAVRQKAAVHAAAAKAAAEEAAAEVAAEEASAREAAAKVAAEEEETEALPSPTPSPSASVHPASVPPAPPPPPPNEDLSSLKCPELRALCKERRLLSTGKKAVLLERLGCLEELRGAAAEDTTAIVSPGKESREEEPFTPDCKSAIDSGEDNITAVEKIAEESSAPAPAPAALKDVYDWLVQNKKEREAELEAEKNK